MNLSTDKNGNKYIPASEAEGLQDMIRGYLKMCGLDVEVSYHGDYIKVQIREDKR